MAIILEAAYSKKLGLPNYSSHSFVVSLRTELADLTQVKGESARLYALLQQSVDDAIQQVGYLPDTTRYGMEGAGATTQPSTQPPSSTVNDNGHHVDEPTTRQQQSLPGDHWTCSDKQKELILKLVGQHRLDKQAVEALAKEMFGLPVKSLNRLQASGLIEELLQRHNKATKGNNGHGKADGAAAYRRHGVPA